MYCLKQVGIENDEGMLDMSRMTEKIPTSHRGRIVKLVEVLNKLSISDEELSQEHIYDACSKIGIEQYEVTAFINELKEKGELIEKRKGVFKLL